MLLNFPSRATTASNRHAIANWISLVGLCLGSLVAHAQEEGARVPPSETVSVVFVVIFGILFVGMIAGFFWYLWMNERKRKPGGDEPNGTHGVS